MRWSDEGYVAFDFETTGSLPEYALQPWRYAAGDFWATSLVWRAKENGKWVKGGRLNPLRSDMQEMLDYAETHGKTLVGSNTPFDISILQAYGLREQVYRCKWLDVVLLWRHWFLEPEYEAKPGKRKSYGLKAFVAEHLPVLAGYEQEIDFHDPSKETRATLHKYNDQDVAATFIAARKWYQLLEQDPRRLRAALIEAQCLPLVAESNLTGMCVDTLAARELQQHLVDVADFELGKLASEGVTEKIVRSPTQLAELMFETWKLPVLKHTKTKNRSTDKEVLHELAFKDERVASLRNYREALNNKTKFADNLLVSQEYNGDGRTHPSAIVFGTYSGRLTYASAQDKGRNKRQTGFALHQMKRDPMFRGLVTAPPGYTLMEFDAAGQEFRWMAIASGDTVMLDLCLPGEDAHSFMGAQVRDIDYRTLIQDVHDGSPAAKSARQLGKVANLSLQYRTSAGKLRSVARVQYGMDMSMALAEKIHRTYRQAYKGVPRYWERQINETKNSGYVETLAGRRVQVIGNWAGNFGWSMGSTAINYRIQGTGGDQKYLAIAMLKEFMLEHGIRFGWDLHDGIYLYVPDEHVERVAVEGKRILDNLPYQKAWGFSPPIPLPWDCKTGGSWGDLEEFNYA